MLRIAFKQAFTKLLRIREHQNEKNNNHIIDSDYVRSQPHFKVYFIFDKSILTYTCFPHFLS